MAARSDTEKLAAISAYAHMLIAMSNDEPPEDMTESEQQYWRAITDGYYSVASTVIQIIETGSARPTRTPPKDTI